MNTELILKYKTEFDHWLNKGKCLFKTKVEGNWIDVDNTTWSFNKDNLIIINDEYVEFRKALAEDKTIQAYANEGFWCDITKESFSRGFKFSMDLNRYRIKPNKPKFKVGDWVRVTQTINNNVTIKRIKTIPSDGWWEFINEDGTAEYQPYRLLEPWKPKPGDWVIPDSGIGENSFVVTKFNGVNPMPKKYQPFIGQLPTNLKE